MSELLNPGNVMFALGILGTIFTVFSYFRNPQVESDKKDALLPQQVQWAAEGSERRFVEMGGRITEAMTLAQNHIHTVDTKVDTLGKGVIEMGKELTRLATIIEERIPKK